MKIDYFYLLIFITCFSHSIKAQNNCDSIVDKGTLFTIKNLNEYVYKLQNDTFSVYHKKKAIPVCIKKQLDCIIGDFSIANPGRSFQISCVSSSKLPKRGLVFLAKNKNLIVLSYFTGGFGISKHLLIIKYQNDKIVDLWTCSAGSTSNIDSIKGIVSYILNNWNEVLYSTSTSF